MTDAAVPLPTPDLPAGTCWLVATPIGNLDDVSLRALAVLGGVDLVLAEDTRRTRTLLTRYGVKARLEAFHDHNKERQAPKVVE
ncbi:16S rRNA (cytidine(1402)-2'-O)-methyltransferase, partial [bacterium]|nr:16S rRNA (cytidine(1402)-2'-O)-methyltransferase [bacterium]